MKAVDLLRPAQLTLLILLAAIGPLIVMRGTRTFPRYNLIEIFERLNLITVCVFH